MVGFFNSEVDFATVSSTSSDDTDYKHQSHLNLELKKRTLKATLMLIKKMVKINNIILALFLILTAIWVNFPASWPGMKPFEVNESLSKDFNIVSYFIIISILHNIYSQLNVWNFLSVR